MLKSKVHRITVTDQSLHYEGSLTLDVELMKLANMKPYEQVLVADVDNGVRFETYLIPGTSKECCVNGAAARLTQVGDRLIIMTYADYEDDELATFEPIAVRVDDSNMAI